jgi:hypothetical protein
VGLEYKGNPELRRDRDFVLSNLDRDRISEFISREPTPTEAEETDKLFDDIAKLFLKGEALKNAIGDMDPAGFIPVEDGSEVIAAINRLQPSETTTKVITFGLFKDAVEYLSSRSSAIDEEFVRKYNFIDPNLEHSSVTTKHKGISSSGKDWITSFLELLAPFAGLQLAGYIHDVFIMNTPKATFPDDEVRQWGTTGFLVGLALLIELGSNAKIFLQVFGGKQGLDPQLEQEFNRLYNNPQERKKVLEEANLDYSLFVSNQRFNDSKAVRDYALKYIARQQQSLKYDHWITYLQTLEHQTMVRGPLAMSPMYSEKWRKFKLKNDPPSDDAVNDIFGVLKDTTITSLSDSLRNVILSIQTTTNEQYNRFAASLYLQIDERTLCCLLYFIGPLDTNLLRSISSLLKLASYRVDIDFGDLLKFLIDGAHTALMNMLISYINQILDQVGSKVFEAFFSIPDFDLDDAFRFCPGLNLLLSILELALNGLLSKLDELAISLQATLDSLNAKSSRHISYTVDRRAIATIAVLLDRLAARIDFIQNICREDPTQENFNDNLAEVAVEFVSNELPDLFPIINIPEVERRKHFRNVPSFKAGSLGIEVPGFDSNGNIKKPTESQVKNDCRSNSPANKGVIVAEKLAEAIRNIK